jgi:phosphoribosyl 1,2-cyclic phosphodiesterase/DNA-binding response OmpR family regulator
LRGNILLSHTHWDHIQGIPFFDPLYRAGNKWEIYGPKGLRVSLREVLAAQMQYDYFPVTLDQCAARIRFHDLVEGSFAIEDITVSAQYLNHTALTLGYKLQGDGVTVVYACDHEPHSRLVGIPGRDLEGQDLRHAEFLEGADLVIHDAQYTAEEYPAKVGWGHSPVEYVLKLAQRARVKKLALTHHDPLRDDQAIDDLVRRASRQNSSLDVFAAYEGQIIDLGASPRRRSSSRNEEYQAETLIESTPAVLLCVADKKTSAALHDLLRAERIRAHSCSNIDDTLACIAQHRPSLIFLEHNPPRTDGIGMCCAIRRQAPKDELPIVLLARREDSGGGDAAGITDWLIQPFSHAHARTKMRTWLLRRARPESLKSSVGEDLPNIKDRNSRRDVREENRNDLKRAISSNKSALLWMYGREIAPLETLTFNTMAGEIIAQAMTALHKSGDEAVENETCPLVSSQS